MFGTTMVSKVLKTVAGDMIQRVHVVNWGFVYPQCGGEDGRSPR